MPISNVAPPASRLTSVPEIVTPAAAAFSVTPSTTMKEDCALMSKPSILMSDVVESGIVLEPMIRVPEGSRLMVVPFMVAGGPPAEIIVLAMGKAEGFGVNVWPAIVYTLLGEGSDRLGRSMVELPMASTPD